MYTVLVVDDGLTDMEILTRYLRHAGYSVIPATSGEEARDKIDMSKPDIIFLEVLLPGKSGFDICRELKNNPNTSKIPVVFCSQRDSEVDRIWGNMLGAEAYLSKPIDKEELGVTLRSLLN